MVLFLGTLSRRNYVTQLTNIAFYRLKNVGLFSRRLCFFRFRWLRLSWCCRALTLYTRNGKSTVVGQSVCWRRTGCPYKHNNYINRPRPPSPFVHYRLEPRLNASQTFCPPFHWYLQGWKKCDIWHRFSTTQSFQALSFRNQAKYRITELSLRAELSWAMFNVPPNTL